MPKSKFSNVDFNSEYVDKYRALISEREINLILFVNLSETEA